MTAPGKPTAGFWITVALVATLAYLASFGPAVWLTVRGRGRILGLHTFFMIYEPIRLASEYSGPFASAMDSFAEIGLPAGVSFTVSGGDWAFQVGDWSQAIQE